MHREQLILEELRERHERLGRAANKSDKTPAW